MARPQYTSRVEWRVEGIMEGDTPDGEWTEIDTFESQVRAQKELNWYIRNSRSAWTILRIIQVVTLEIVSEAYDTSARKHKNIVRPLLVSDSGDLVA